MGYLGFLFEVSGVEKIVFVSKDNFDSNIVVGIKEKVILDEVEHAMILGSDLSLKNFPVFNDAKFLYGKISAAKETFIDYEHLTIWFNSDKYRKLRQLFEEKIQNKEDLKKRVVDIYEFFK